MAAISAVLKRLMGSLELLLLQQHALLTAGDGQLQLYIPLVMDQLVYASLASSF